MFPDTRINTHNLTKLSDNANTAGVVLIKTVSSVGRNKCPIAEYLTGAKKIRRYHPTKQTASYQATSLENSDGQIAPHVHERILMYRRKMNSH